MKKFREASVEKWQEFLCGREVWQLNCVVEANISHSFAKRNKINLELDVSLNNVYSNSFNMLTKGEHEARRLTQDGIGRSFD
jgi:hypothetical protein